MRNYRNLIKKGINEPLYKIPFHQKAPIRRLSMLSKSMIPSSKMHIAVHFVDASRKKISEYSKLHKHDVDEINLILSEDENLVYEIQIGDQTYRVSSPSTVFIPKWTKHKARAVSGKGVFVCIIKSNKYRSFNA